MRGKCYCDNYSYHGPKGKVVDAVCPECGQGLPIIGITIDLIVEHEGKIVLVKRRKHGWALPGGFVDYDETLEEAAVREAKEELGASKVTLRSQFHTYGDPDRDRPRRNVSVVYVACVDKVVTLADREPSERQQLEDEGIEDIQLYDLHNMPRLAFDHNELVGDYLAVKRRLVPLRTRRASGDV
jgi:8-oxo-dGTP diphosphatase